MNVNRFIYRHLLLLLLLALPTVVYSDPQLSCSGVSEKWFLSIDPILEAFEYKVNNEIQKYVSVADFNVGDDDFGAAGTGDLGHITIPKFDKKTPRQYLKSAVQDLGISPSYTINAKILGSMFEVVRVSISGGQGCKSKVNEGACNTGTPTDGQSGKDRLTLDVKVAGYSILNDENNSAETEVNPLDEPVNPGQMAAKLPSKEKKGTGGELLDIRRGFNGDQPIARIPIYNIFFITIDAGYVLHAGLIFTYGVKSEGIFSVGGEKSYAMDMKSFAPKAKPTSGTANPALDPEEYKNCSYGTSACYNSPSTPVWSKTSEFWSSMDNAAAQNAIDSYKGVRDALRDVRIREAYRDAKLTTILFKEKYEQLKSDTSLTPEQKMELMQEMDLGPIKKDIKNIDRLIDNVNYSADTLKSAYNLVEQSIQSISEGQVPEVTANVGVVLDGRAVVWLNASVEVNLVNMVRAWAGIQGDLTILDAAMGIGASVSSRSQYLDLTGKLDYEVLHGDILVIWGYSLFGQMVNNSGSFTLFSFPGKIRTNNSLIARMDFDPPSGSDMFFWCANLFDNSANLDTERCNDGDAALRKLTPGLAAHDDYQKFVLDEPSIGKNDSCVIASEGNFLYTSDEGSSACDTYLPNSNDNLNTIISASGVGIPHPLAKAFKLDAGLFTTFLRNDSNKPFINFSSLKPNNAKLTKTYTSSQSIQYDTLPTGQIVPRPFLPSSDIPLNASIEDRIVTFTSHGILHDQSKDPTNTIDPEYETQIADGSYDGAAITDSRLQIKLDGISNGAGVYPNGSSVFIGHLIGLSNDTLIDLAEDYRLGQCRISSQTGTRKMLLNERSYPIEGAPSGTTSINAGISRLGCDLGSNSPSSGQIKEWEACQLRTAIMKGECFPKERIIELLEVANLSDQDIFKFFKQPNKRITGTLDFGNAKKETMPTYYGYQQSVFPSTGSRAGVPISITQPPTGTEFSQWMWLNDRNNLGSIANRASPSGTCPGFSKTPLGNGNFASTPFVQFMNQNSSSIYPMIGNQTFQPEGPDRPVWDSNWWGNQYYGPGLVFADDNVDPDSSYICIDDDFVPGNGNPANDRFLDYTPQSYGLSEYAPHQVTVMCERDYYFVPATGNWSTYLPDITWHGYIRSAKIIKPYAIRGFGQDFPLDEGTYAISEIYDEQPTSGNSGHFLSDNGSICQPAHNKNIINFPYGPGYGQAKLQQMLSGALNSFEMIKAIRLCVNTGACKYVPLTAKHDDPPVCNIQAAIGGVIAAIDSATSPGKNLNACLSSKLEYTNAESFCRKHQSQILNTIGSSTGTKVVEVSGKWSQDTDVGNVLNHVVSDPTTGRRTIGKCVYEKENNTYQLLGSANKQSSNSESGDCELRAVGPMGDSLTINRTSITSSNKGGVTAQACKSRFGYLSGSMSSMDQIRTLDTCTSLTGTQLLELRANDILPETGDGTFDLKAFVTVSGSTNNGQSTTVGSCTWKEADINERINQQTKCRLNMTTLNGYSVAPIDIYLPSPVAGVSRLQQCADQMSRYRMSFGQPATCPAEIRKRPEYAALMAMGVNFINYYFTLGNTPAGNGYGCEGPPIREDQTISSSEYNNNCIANLVAEKYSQNIQINLTPVERMSSIDPNEYLSTDAGSPPLAVDRCTEYWTGQMTHYKPNGTLTNHKFCQSIHNDVKNYLPIFQPSIPASNSTYNGSNTWSGSSPMSGTVVTVTGNARVFAVPPPCPGCPNLRVYSPIDPKKTDSTKNKSAQSSTDLVSVVTSTGLESLKEDEPGGGGDPDPGIPDWMNGPDITQCSYEFKQLDNGDWDLMDSAWVPATDPANTYNSNVRERRCIKDVNGLCIDTNVGDLLVFAGSGGRALKQYSASQVPSPLNQAFVDQFCDANYNRIVPLADNLVSDPNLRFPVWLKFVDANGDVDVPTATSSTSYYCKPKSCELWVEFGQYSQATESEWKNKLSAMPTTATACRTYYQNQVSAYCSKLLLLAQMPDNMDVTLKSKFDNQETVVGICPATETRRTCNIGQREPDTWISWLTGSGFSTVESVENFNKALLIPSSFSKKDLIIADFFPNTLAACVESAQELNYGNQLCARDAAGIDHSGPYEIAVQFGEFTQTIASCSGYTPVTTNSPRVAEQPLSASIQSNEKCSATIQIDNYVPNATIQIAACAHRNCSPEDLRVIFATKPDTQKDEITLNFNEILTATWSKTARGSGSIYINQADRLGNLGEWVQINSDAYAKYGNELVNGCNIPIADLSAKIVGTLCEKTYIELDGYEPGAVVEIGVCQASGDKCTQKDFSAVYKQGNLQESQMEFLPIIETTWSYTGEKGSIGIRQHYNDGTTSRWSAVDQKTYLQAALNAISECGVKP